jgi:hypothetical protein
MSEWILCKDRLPTKDGQYLVTEEGVYDNYVDVLYFALDLYNANELAFRDKKGQSGWYVSDSEYGDYMVDDVLAWQELPKPYKEQKEKTDD